MLLERLLSLLTPNLDHARVVHQLRRAESLPLVLPYLKAVQKENVSVVNEALNELYIDDEDYWALRESIDAHDNFDQVGGWVGKEGVYSCMPLQRETWPARRVCV